jgi:hypothetical protein
VGEDGLHGEGGLDGGYDAQPDPRVPPPHVRHCAGIARGGSMIEEFSHEYDNFFDEQRHEVRWKRLRATYEGSQTLNR